MVIESTSSVVATGVPASLLNLEIIDKLPIIVVLLNSEHILNIFSACLYCRYHNTSIRLDIVVNRPRLVLFIFQNLTTVLENV
jgi:hypothetical protein